MNIQIPQRVSPRIGENIDHYRVDKELGEGTFGIVYRVTDTKNQNTRALKVLKLWTVADDRDRESLRQRFDHEYKTGQINSNHLVHSVDYGNILGNPYIVMEYCSGGDLSSSIGNMPSGQLNRVSAGILQGLDDLHRSAKVHRDLKPENVLLNQNGDALLTDFGVSGDANRRMTESDWMKRAKAIFGTYAYISPEQFDRKFDATVLPTTDIFSFGVMFYQMITGELPFGRLETDSDLADYIKNMKAGSWKRTNFGNSKWEEVVARSLKPNFKDRFQSTAEIIPLLGVSSDRFVNSANFTRSIKGGNVGLRVLQGENYGMLYNLSNLIENNCGLITVGRYDFGVSNSVPIIETQSCYVSRYHATIERVGTINWIIRDGQWRDFSWRESTNGTFVNSTEVNSSGIVMKEGDIISIGDVKLKVEVF